MADGSGDVSAVEAVAEKLREHRHFDFRSNVKVSSFGISGEEAQRDRKSYAERAQDNFKKELCQTTKRGKLAPWVTSPLRSSILVIPRPSC